MMGQRIRAWAGSGTRHRWGVWGLGLLLSLGLSWAQTPGSAVRESDLKAAYLFNLCKLSDWPDSGGPAEFVLGVWHSPPLLSSAQAFVGQKIQGRSWRVIQVNSPEDLSQCQAVYLGGPLNSELKVWLSRAGKLPVLTVGESEGFARSNGAIEFLTQDRKLRFMVNLRATRSASIRISPAVLQLASTVLKEDNP
jgi:hypothetical protein